MKKVLLPLLLTFSHAAFAKEVVYTKQAPEPIGVYSQAIKVDNTVYISGQIPIDPVTGKMVSGNFKAQIQQALHNLQAIVQASGGKLENIVKVTVYLTDLNNFSIVNDVMNESFTKPYPARAVMEVKALPKNAPVEIEAIMQLPRS